MDSAADNPVERTLTMPVGGAANEPSTGLVEYFHAGNGCRTSVRNEGGPDAEDGAAPTSINDRF